MPTRANGPGTFEAVDAFDGGVGWIAHPDETMQRAGRALVDDGDVWVVDPVDAGGLDDRLTDLGAVAGVVVLFNYHRRDASAVALRHGVSVHLPEGMTALSDDDLAAPVERLDGRLGDTGYYLHEVDSTRLWQEWALFDGETLIVPESVGSADYFRAPGERLGVSPVRRLRPPRGSLGGLEPERILPCHGEGISIGASQELERALRESRRTAPRHLVRYGPTLLRNLYAATIR